MVPPSRSMSLAEKPDDWRFGRAANLNWRHRNVAPMGQKKGGLRFAMGDDATLAVMLSNDGEP